MITLFTPYLSLFGGILIGLSALLLMKFHGKIAGMTGILAGVIPPVAKDWAVRLCFLLGAILAPVLYLILGGEIAFAVPSSMLMLTIGGFLVGIGVHIGSGCTSGHGVCGIARLSRRSITATLVFMCTAFVTVYISRHLLGV